MKQMEKDLRSGSFVHTTSTRTPTRLGCNAAAYQYDHAVSGNRNRAHAQEEHQRKLNQRVREEIRKRSQHAIRNFRVSSPCGAVVAKLTSDSAQGGWHADVPNEKPHSRKDFGLALSGLDVNDAKEDARVQKHDGSRDVQSRISKDQQTVS